MNIKLASISLLALSLAACSRVETGQSAIRVNFDKTIEKEELLPGSFNQTLFGDVLLFPVKDVSVSVEDLTPLASDNSTVADFDVSIIYNINPSSVADIYTTKSRSFHATDDEGHTYLMFNYMHQVGRNAVYKIARRYESLKMNDSRAEIENSIREEVVRSLQEEKLDTSINISQVLVKQIIPAKNIVQSANLLVQAQNERKRKAVEVDTAKLEAERIAALNANAGATKYMEATAIVTIAEAVAAGKVNTIVIPYDFKGIVNVK
jgi:regulator of protease activity HflC (stomatin/prohibitin superfamily)